MQYSSLLLLGAAGLAAAVPANVATREATLSKRETKNYCQAAGFNDASIGAAHGTMDYLNGSFMDKNGEAVPEVFFVAAGKCTVLNEKLNMHDTSVYYCNDDTKEAAVNPKNLADMIDNAYKECISNTWYGESGNDIMVHAFQHWSDAGKCHVLIRGS